MGSFKLIKTMLDNILQGSGIRGHKLDFTSNFLPLVVRSGVFVICLMMTVFIMPVYPIRIKHMAMLNCSLVKCLMRNLGFINDWMEKFGIWTIFRTAWDDLVPKSPKQFGMIVIKIYLALVLSLLLYRKVFKNERQTKIK